MRAKIINYNGYRYPQRDTGELKEGASITVEELVDFSDDDHNHNFAYGHNVKSVRLSNTVMQNYKHFDIVSLIGKEVELVFATAPGSKYETLVEINEI